jgi:hypothetical protein
LRQDFKAP